MTYIQLTPSMFDALASGAGGVSAIETLRFAQHSKHLLLAGQLLQTWPGTQAERDAIADLMEQARQHDNERYAGVMGAPLVGAWVGIVIRAQRRDSVRLEDFRHLNALAVVACAAAGVAGEAEIPVRDGVASVPGLGAFLMPDAGQAWLTAGVDGSLSARTQHGTVVRVPASRGEQTSQWLPVRRLTAESGDLSIDLGLDDLDPFRHGHHVPPAPRLTGEVFGQWQELFTQTWHLLGQHLPERAAELATGLGTLVPLLETDTRSARSATIRHAFGVFGLTRPPTPAEFVVTLVHEFQHSKLSAMLDMAPMTDPEDRSRHFAPWRVDPRPLAGLLQGVYAFVGVADSWRALREADGLSELATARFAEARLQVDRGLTSVEQSGSLLEAGRALAAQLRKTTDRFLAEPLPPAAVKTAEESLARTHQLWLERRAVTA